MKTTVEIPDTLFREAKELTTREGIPLRELVERGLRLALDREPKAAVVLGSKPFRLKTITTRGQGLLCDPDWSTIRSII